MKINNAFIFILVLTIITIVIAVRIGVAWLDLSIAVILGLIVGQLIKRWG